MNGPAIPSLFNIGEINSLTTLEGVGAELERLHANSSNKSPSLFPNGPGLVGSSRYTVATFLLRARMRVVDGSNDLRISFGSLSSLSPLTSLYSIVLESPLHQCHNLPYGLSHQYMSIDL